MSQYVAIARPYANALFDVVSESQRFDLWQQILRVLSALSTDNSFIRLAQQPGVKVEQVVSLVVSCVNECLALEPVDEQVLRHFVGSLADKKRLVVMAAVEQLYSKKLAQQQQVVNVEVTSASTLSSEQQHDMIAALKRRFNSEVSVRFDEDQELIGGAIIRAGTWVMDGSVRQKLNKLQECIRG